MEENVNEEKEFVEKKKKGVIVTIVICLFIVVLLGGAYLGYFYYYQNTNRFLDNISKNLISFIDNNVNLNSLKQISDNNLDVELKGDIEMPNVLKLNYDLKNSSSKKLTSLELGAENLLKGTLYIQNQKIYLEASDLYNGLLEIPSEIEEFDSESLADISNIDFSKAASSIIKYYFEALKEGKQTTTIKGLTEKEYNLTLDEISSKNASLKLKELLTNDENLKMLFSDSEEFDLGIKQIKVRVNVWTNQVKEFTIVTTNNEFNGSYDGDKYTITNKDGDKIYLRSEKGYLKIYTDESFGSQIALTISEDEGLELTYKEEKNYLTFSLTKVDAKNIKLSLDGMIDGTKINLSGTEEMVSDYESNLKFNVKVNSDGQNIELNLTMNLLFKENLITEINTTNAKSIENLTEEEQNNIMLKLYSILGKTNLLEGMI